MINNYYISKGSPYRVTVTGLAGNSVSAEETALLTDVNAYNTTNGMKASTTGNITGVYDLSGGLTEMVACYILSGSDFLYGSGNGLSSGNLMGATSEVNPNGYQNLSTRDYTVYPYDGANSNYFNNYNVYKGLISSMYGYGDAILEISSSGSSSSGSNNNNSWNNNSSFYLGTIDPFFFRGRRI